MAKFIAASEIADPVAAVRSTYALNYSDDYAVAHDAEIIERSLANAELRSTPEGRATQMSAVQAHDTRARLHEIACPTFVAQGPTTAPCLWKTGGCSPRASRAPDSSCTAEAGISSSRSALTS
jgi:hypothetical protein